MVKLFSGCLVVVIAVGAIVFIGLNPPKIETAIFPNQIQPPERATTSDVEPTVAAPKIVDSISELPEEQPAKNSSLSSEGYSSPPSAITILEEFKWLGNDWLSILLPPTVQKEEFIEVAKWVHRNHKGKRIKWFTDDKLYKEYREAEIKYPAPMDKKVEAWGNSHHFGISNFMNNTSWQFVGSNKRAMRFFPKTGGFELE